MNAIPTALHGVYAIEPKVFGDERGFFYESFNATRFAAITGAAVEFVQDNHSRSARGVLRGLHYQARRAPRASWCGSSRGRCGTSRSTSGPGHRPSVAGSPRS